MNENKVLVKVIVPELDKSYDVFIPINRKIGNIIGLLNKSISDMNEDCFEISNKRCLYNRYTGTRYNFNNLLYETDIRNDSVLILM